MGWWQTGFDWRPEVHRQLLRPQSGHQGRGQAAFVYERAGPGTTRIGPVPAEMAQLSFPVDGVAFPTDPGGVSPLSESESGMVAIADPGEGLVVAGQGGEVAWGTPARRRRGSFRPSHPLED